MKIVIQCAAKKNDEGLSQLRNAGGQRVQFVAQPDLAPAAQDVAYVRPDSLRDSRQSWRQFVLACNAYGGREPPGFVSAIDLYAPPAYRALAERFGIESVFILSAGWGLVPGSFRIPSYDITFSAAAAPWTRRRIGNIYDDFALLESSPSDTVVFLGGASYLSFFAELTAHCPGHRVAFYNAITPPVIANCEMRRYVTNRRTNWHYSCAMDLVEGRLAI